MNIDIFFLLKTTTKARKGVQLLIQGKTGLFNSKCSYNYNGQFIPIDKLLQDTKDYFKETYSTSEYAVLQQLLNLRLEQFERDMTQFEKESVNVDGAEYHLIGALMVRYDGTLWCLYLRDYIESPEGVSWRILGSDEEKRVRSNKLCFSLSLTSLLIYTQ